MVFREKTAFIVGAGASNEVGMPLGSDLATLIHRRGRLEGGVSSYSGPDTVILKSLVQRFGAQHAEAALTKLRGIAAGVVTASSIDNYLDRMRHDEEIASLGKLLIAHFILASEAKSALNVKSASKGALDPLQFSRTWLRPFSLKLFEDLPFSKLDEISNNVTIVCFNYDRCIERYLQEAVRIGYGVSQSVAHDTVARIPILRPYGGLGPLPIEPTAIGSAVGYGQSLDGSDLWAISDRLRTFTEQVDENAEELAAIKSALREAKQVVYLGFGFHRQNMKLLTAQSNLGGRRIYATGYGVSKQEHDTVVSLIGQASDIPSHRYQHVHLELGASSAQLFEFHGRNIQ